MKKTKVEAGRKIAEGERVRKAFKGNRTMKVS